MADVTESGPARRTGVRTVATRWLEGLSEAQFAYLLLTPAFLLLGLIAFWPLLRTFEMSLHADALASAEAIGGFVGLANYEALLAGTRDFMFVRPFVPDVTLNGTFPFVHVPVRSLFTSALTATLIFTVASVTVETLVGFGQALVLDQEFRGRRWVRVAIIIPWAVPIVIQGMIFYLLFQPGIGFLAGSPENPTILNELGILGYTPLADPVDSMLIIVVADVWKTSAFVALLVLAGLQSIDRDLYSVARVAGATRWQRFRLVTLPLVLPTVLVAMLFRTIDAMRVFGIIETVAGCNVVPSLSCIVVTTFNSRMYGSASAIAFLTALLIGVVVSVYIWQYEATPGGGAG